jgi:glycosyltransferase involved in cell wall biosynthesis
MDADRPIKILILTSGYPRYKEDSASIFLRHLAENLAKHGIQVHVLAPADKTGGTCIEEKITIHRFQYFPVAWQQLAYGSGILPNLKRKPWLWIQVPFFFLAMTYFVLRLIRKEPFDLIHAHWILPQGLVAVFAKLLYKKPVITTAHGSDAFALQGRILDKLKRLVLRRSDAWTSNTHATAEAFGQDLSLSKPHVIPMGVDVKHFREGQRTKLRVGILENEFVILFVGRLVEEKGLDGLLKALTLLPSESRCRTTLWVVGDGQDRGKLQQYSETLSLKEKVRFWGSISNDLLPDFYAAADLLVVPSDTEGQGVVLTEAFAARLCVLATEVGGITEVIEDGRTGMLVQPHNPQQLVSAIEKLLSNGRLREKLAENAFAIVKNNYDGEKIAMQFEALYREILRSCPARLPHLVN